MNSTESKNPHNNSGELLSFVCVSHRPVKFLCTNDPIQLVVSIEEESFYWNKTDDAVDAKHARV